jgi:hypothetical protein
MDYAARGAMPTLEEIAVLLAYRLWLATNSTPGSPEVISGESVVTDQY